MNNNLNTQNNSSNQVSMNSTKENSNIVNGTSLENKQMISNSNTLEDKKPGMDNTLKIEETTTTKSQHGTVAVAQVTSNGVNVLTDKLPDAIDISNKMKKVIEKNGKKVRIMTKRELITNIILSVVFILLIGAGGYGVYYYFFFNNPRNFEVKDIKIEYGSEIPSSVLNYINLTDISEPDYTLNLSNVKKDIGTYNYTVSYGNTVKTGKITIEDTTAPVVTFKDNLEFEEGSTITKEMLVSECSDISECSYDLTSPIDTSKTGKVEASITAIDNLGNKKDYPVNINIYEKIIKIICNKNNLDMEKKIITVSEYEAYFKSDKSLKKGKYRDIVSIIGDTNYETNKDSYKSNGYILDDSKKTATKESDIDNISNLTNQGDIKMHLESNGYTCRIVE